MEQIFFEVQLCIKISIFKEISNIDILIILCLGTSLQLGRLQSLRSDQPIARAFEALGSLPTCM